MYVVATHLGAKTPPATAKEYGPATLQIDVQDPLFDGLEGQEHRVWMSHGDRVEAIPSTLRSIAHTDNAPCAPTFSRISVTLVSMKFAIVQSPGSPQIFSTKLRSTWVPHGVCTTSG